MTIRPYSNLYFFYEENHVSDNEFRLLIKACLKGVRSLNLSDEEIDDIVNNADIKASDIVEYATEKLISSYFRIKKKTK